LRRRRHGTGTADRRRSTSRTPSPAHGPSPAPGPAPVSIHYASFATAALGIGAALNGRLAFPADTAWNTDISDAAVDPNSGALIARIGLATGLHPDFGAGLYNGAPIGIPCVVVAGERARRRRLGGVDTGDRHVLVIDRDANRLYEPDDAAINADGSWDAACGAVFHLDSDTVRPTAQPGWTSADAAGLPIFPGLARYDPGLARYEEAAAGPGGIRPALRFTVQQTRRAWVHRPRTTRRRTRARTCRRSACASA